MVKGRKGGRKGHVRSGGGRRCEGWFEKRRSTLPIIVDCDINQIAAGSIRSPSFFQDIAGFETLFYPLIRSSPFTVSRFDAMRNYLFDHLFGKHCLPMCC